MPLRVLASPAHPIHIFILKPNEEEEQVGEEDSLIMNGTLSHLIPFFVQNKYTYARTYGRTA